MSTKYQNSTENTLVRAVDSSLEPSASTQKVFVKRFDGIDLDAWDEMIAWCKHNLYHGGHYEPKWYLAYPSFYFTDEKEYMLFLLRWS